MSDAKASSGTTVGIMSMQRIFNYGSSLQAYSLKRLIQLAQPDADIRFLDYTPGDVLIQDSAAPSSGLRRRLSKVLEYGRGEGSVRDKIRFFEHKRGYARRNFPLVGIPASPDRDLAVDVQVIGSDEVFNCVQANANVGYSRDLFGHGSPAGRVVSYAASFGNTTLEKIESAGIGSELAADFARFAEISVRDRNSQKIVEALTGRTPDINVDPALAFDLMSLETRIPQGRLTPEPYIIVYGYSGRLGRAENDELRRYADSRGASILTFGGVQGCADRFVDCSPFELLAYFRDAEAVVTDTFHGTIFSIINRRPFATIVRPSHGDGYGNEEKLAYLLDSFGLASRRLSSVSQVADLLAEPIDYSAVDPILERERARTKAYLARAIQGDDAQ